MPDDTIVFLFTTCQNILTSGDGKPVNSAMEREIFQAFYLVSKIWLTWPYHVPK